MAKNKKKRHEIEREKKAIQANSNQNQQNSNFNSRMDNQKSDFKSKAIDNDDTVDLEVKSKKGLKAFLENKHIPIFGRWYKIFVILSKEKSNKKELKKHLIIALGGLVVIAAALALAILSFTGAITVDFGGDGNAYFAAAMLAVIVITGIFI